MRGNIQQSRETYNITYWSGGYFDVNSAGNLIARPDRSTASEGVDLFKLTQEIGKTGLSLPVLVRFSNILHDRVDLICNAFTQAMMLEDYQATYTVVYPIKVNQQRSVVEEIIGHGGERVGLEAGSKPELMAVLALANPDGGVVICNGYKDREYVRLALVGRQLGMRVYIVVEKLSELDLIIEESTALGIAPLLGMRVRLASISQGNWQNTGGEKSKFGLSAAQVLEMVGRLEEAGLTSSLQLLHCHLGSQIANIRDIQRGMQEAARYYAELRRIGINISSVDIGGGLGIDYEGTRSRSFCSMNYTVQEYANSVVHTFWEICTSESLPYPDIFSESGRALTAHHAVLLTEVVDSERVPDAEPPQSLADDAPQIIKDLELGLQNISSRSALEVYHDAIHWLAMAQDMYTHGVLTLEQRAQAEQIYFATCHRVRPLLQAASRTQRQVLDELNEKLTDKYFCNFSVFQSIPDVWAINQIFPVMPIHRLDQAPDRRGIITDLTCDSDGRIDLYVDKEGVESTLPLHHLREGEPYILGIFLVGAYQEILGDLHNLFGDTNSVNIEMTTAGEYRLLQPLHGDSVDAVLRYVQFNPDELMNDYYKKIEHACLDPEHEQQCLEILKEGLTGYTYLED